MQAQTVSNAILVAPNSNDIKLVPMAMMEALKGKPWPNTQNSLLAQISYWDRNRKWGVEFSLHNCTDQTTWIFAPHFAGDVADWTTG